jgi:hypothetical protein
MFRLHVNSCGGIPKGLKPYVKVLTTGLDLYYIGKTKYVENSTIPQFDPSNNVPYYFHFTRARTIRFLILSHNSFFPDKKLGSYEFFLSNATFNTPLKAPIVAERGVNADMHLVFTIFSPVAPLPRRTLFVHNEHVETETGIKASRDVTVFLTFNPPITKPQAGSISIFFIKVVKQYGAYDILSSQNCEQISRTNDYYGPSGLTGVICLNTKCKFPISSYGANVDGEIAFIPFINTTGEYQGTVIFNFVFLSQLYEENSAVSAFDCRRDSDAQYVSLNECAITITAPGAYSCPLALESNMLNLVNNGVTYSQDIESLAKNVSQSYLSDFGIAFRRFVWTECNPVKMQDCLSFNGRSMPSTVVVELLHDFTTQLEMDFTGYDENNRWVMTKTHAITDTKVFSQPNMRHDTKSPYLIPITYTSIQVGFNLTTLKQQCTRIVFECQGVTLNDTNLPTVIVHGDGKEIFSMKIPLRKNALLTLHKIQSPHVWDMYVELK